MSPALHVLDHPLAKVLITQLRDVDTPSDRFRIAMQRLAALLFMQASQHISLSDVEVTTPLMKTQGSKLARPIVLVPVLRAGLGLVDGILHLVPDAVVAHIGIARDEETANRTHTTLSYRLC